MYYVTARQSPRVRQMSVEELFSAVIKPVYINKDTTSTFTRKYDEVPYKYQIMRSIQCMVAKLHDFNERYDYLRKFRRESLYRRFYLPKKSGGLRPIDAPNDELKKALSELKDIFTKDFGALYHTSAFAYIEKRDTLKALQRHKNNNSRWFGKFDLSGFFPSTTLSFTISMLERIFPFSEILSWEDGRQELCRALELGFLNDSLPQGTPLSPCLTNIIMIPIDFEFNKKLRDMEQSFVCTRYADDFLISSRYTFDINEIGNTLKETMAEFNAPYILKREKTRYGSSAGQNWNFGLMLNANNEITVGHKRKREFKAMLTNFILDSKNGKYWDLEDVAHMDGIKSYYMHVEKETINSIINNLNEKFNVNIEEMIKEQRYGIIKGAK